MKRQRSFWLFNICLLATLAILPWSPPRVDAAGTNDLRGMVLRDGSFDAPNPKSLTFEQEINTRMYREAVINIEYNGSVSGSASVPYDDLQFYNTPNLYTGKALLSMDGSYDADENTLKGTFKVKQTAAWEDDASSVNWSLSHNGTFTGSRAVDGSVILVFSGTQKWTSVKEAKVEGGDAWDTNGTNEVTYSVTFSDTASVPKESNEEGPCGYSTSSVHSAKQFTFVPSAYAIDSGARFTDFTGEVTVAPGSDPEDERPAELDMVLDVGSIIKTESDSCAIISFADMTTFILKPFTTVILETPPEKESKLSLLTGKIWANVKRMVKDGSMDITMNQAVVGIKGTTFVLEDDGTTSTLKVIDGTVTFSARTTDQKTTVGAGETSQATKNGLQQKQTFDADQESAEWAAIQNQLSESSDTTATETKDKPGTGIDMGLSSIAIILIVVISSLVIIKKKRARRLEDMPKTETPNGQKNPES